MYGVVGDRGTAQGALGLLGERQAPPSAPWLAIPAPVPCVTSNLNPCGGVASSVLSEYRDRCHGRCTTASTVGAVEPWTLDAGD